MGSPIKIFSYSRCGTCSKALNWLNDNNIDYQLIDIINSPPSKQFFEEAVKQFPNRISVGLDLINNKVAVKGWTKIIGDRDAVYYFKKFSDIWVESIIYTDISKDGLLKGPNLEKIKHYKNIIEVPLIASGGVSGLEDLLTLAKMNVSGVIVGKAIYDKKINLNRMFSLGK